MSARPPAVPKQPQPTAPVDLDALRGRLDRATTGLDHPIGVLDVVAFDRNADSLAARGAGKPLRVATKSVRSREALRRVLARPGWRGVLAYTLAEALRLVRVDITRDAVVGYPTTDRRAIAELAADDMAANAITLMVDDAAQLDLIDEVVAPTRRHMLRVCLDLDGSWRPAGVHIGVRRSPVRSAAAAGALAAVIARRRGFALVGVMCYEAQIAGVGDKPPGRPLRAVAVRAMQSRSYADLLARRAAAVAAVRNHAELAFVNGGGTGSVLATAADPTVTEVAAGSGLYGPALFDEYRAWRPTPAAFFGLPVVRRPTDSMVTVLGGGWVASGESDSNRLPTPYLPGGLSLLPREGAGEVQTPLTGPGAARLQIGDTVWFRHAKAGELCEHINSLAVLENATIVASWPTYRGEGWAFL